MGPDRQIDIRNGLRSHTMSPAVDADSSATDGSENQGSDVKMRVGTMYQAEIPEFKPGEQTAKVDRAMTVWTPCPESAANEEQISDYLKVAKEKHGYNTEQALGMLFWHGHNVNKARSDLAQFTPIPDDWSVQDKNLFEQAFLFHGKSFHRIKQMLPEKTIGSLVKYYYSWKKTRSKASLMDKNISAEKTVDSSSSEESDEDMAVLGRRFDRGHKKSSIRGPRTAKERAGRRRHGRARGIRMNREEVEALLTGASVAINAKLDDEQTQVRQQVQLNKQQLSAVGDERPNIDEFRDELPIVKTSPVWTETERLLAVQAVSELGNDREAIADLLGTKTAAHVRTFFSVYNKQYGLDAVYEQWLRRKFGADAANHSSSLLDADPPSDARPPSEQSAGDKSENGNGAS